MTFDLQRMDWMPSPSLVPLAGPLDLDHLARMTLGDVKLEHEVLRIFAEQSMRLISMMAELPPEASARAHNLKGSACGIGAFVVAEAAAQLEAAIRTGDNPPRAFAQLKEAVVEACDAIEVILRQS